MALCTLSQGRAGLLALVLTSCGLLTEAHAQALPFPIGAGAAQGSTSQGPSNSSASSPDSGNSSGGRASRAGRAAAADSAAGTGASQGYAQDEGTKSSTLHVEPDTSQEIGKPFAHVVRLAGDIASSAPDSNEVRHLKVGDSVHVGDHLLSSDGGEMLLQANDASMIALRPASELWIESYLSEGKPADHMVLRLVDGGARMVGGWIPHVNPAGLQVETPTATIGTGDSDHETFVVSDQLGRSIRERPGTYDKINRGSTVMRAANQDLEIEVGHVGFVGVAPPSTTHTHTVLLPASLDKTPAFYARGSFDEEMDRYVMTLDQTSDAMLQRQLGNVTLSVAVCDPVRAGKAWLQKLDAAVARRDAGHVNALFTEDAKFTTSARGSSGTATSRQLDRGGFTEELISIPSAGNASQQRVSGTFTAASDVHQGGCPEVIVQSLVMHRGTVEGKPYRAQSLETYHLDLINDAWLAVSAVSVPQ